MIGHCGVEILDLERLFAVVIVVVPAVGTVPDCFLVVIVIAVQGCTYVVECTARH